MHYVLCADGSERQKSTPCKLMQEDRSAILHGAYTRALPKADVGASVGLVDLESDSVL